MHRAGTALPEILSPRGSAETELRHTSLPCIAGRMHDDRQTKRTPRGPARAAIEDESWDRELPKKLKKEPRSNHLLRPPQRSQTSRHTECRPANVSRETGERRSTCHTPRKGHERSMEPRAGAIPAASEKTLVPRPEGGRGEGKGGGQEQGGKERARGRGRRERAAAGSS